MSIGIGGHVNPQVVAPEQDGAAFLSAALQQELDEELFLPVAASNEHASSPKLLGLLNDDATEVGSVHVGLVYAIDFADDRDANVAVREVSKMAGGFRHLAELANLWQDPARFESWSRMLFQAGVAHQVGGPGQQAVSRSQQPKAARPAGAERNENG
jgi:predicted NUDIX family phosphoesterase